MHAISGIDTALILNLDNKKQLRMEPYTTTACTSENVICTQWLPTGHITSPCIKQKMLFKAVQHSLLQLLNNLCYQLEIHSTEQGICPIAPFALSLTLYSLTGSRV